MAHPENASRVAPRRRGTVEWALLAALAYVPLLATRPGRVAADTKQYLYLDPGRLLQGAASMWDPDQGMGTVTHQNIGYLFPMGPYYWLVHAVGLPVWIGQRIWMGTLLLAAGTGVLFCCRLLGIEGPGRPVAALAYMTTPFIVDYIARISAILMPWAALGWMLGLAILSVRRGGWRHPALLALVVFVVGGVNATSILLVGLAPFLWVVHAVWVTREVPLRAAAAAVGRIGLLSVLVSLWWAAGLWAEGSYGLSILQYTETAKTVATTSLASEVMRGLGYWFFYGQDKVQPWTEAAVPYMQALWLLAVSFAVPAVCLVAGAVTRWRYRSYALGLVVVGTVVAVGPYPYDHPSPLGHLLESASGSSVGLAMRSSNRVLPVVVLGLALLLGAGLSGLAARRPRRGALAAVACAGLVLADLPALWTGGLVARNLSRPSALPSYWTAAASWLDNQPGAAGTRVLGIPGEDFAAYRWGVTEDPVPPGLLTRPYVARQVVPQGEPPGVDLLSALDGSIQNGVFDPTTLAPIARLISAGDVLVQSDLQYERYSLPLPAALWAQLQPTPAGLAPPTTFGRAAATPVIRFPLVNETRLGLPAGTGNPPPLAAFPVPGARPLARAESPGANLIVAGSGQGLVDAAAAGLLAGDPTVLYSATLDSDPTALARELAGGAVLVVTDTNAKAGRRWGSLQDNVGYIEQAGERPLVADPSDQPLPPFPGQAPDARTTTVLPTVDSVRASAYGNPITYTPEDRPSNAVDGNPATAWSVAAFSNAVGERLEIRPARPVTTGNLVLLQAPGGNRHITRVELTFDHGAHLTADLGPASLGGAGQTVAFPRRTFRVLDIKIESTTDDGGRRRSFDGLSGVGFAEVGLPGVNVQESVQMPGDLLRTAGAASARAPLVLLMDRLRAPDVPPRTDPELRMVRGFDLPTGRVFSLGGTARLSAGISDARIDALIGTTSVGGPPGPRTAGGTDPVVGADSTTRLPGDRRARADAALDGDPATAWSSALGDQVGATLTFDLARPLRFDRLDLQVVADGLHSIPTRITVGAGGQERTVDLPAVAPGVGRAQGATSAAPVSFPALTGSRVTVRIDAVHPVTSLDYYGGFSGRRDTLPIAIAELGLPGASRSAPPATLPGTCRSDLIRVDGRPVPVAVTGPTAAALDGSGLVVRPCGRAAAGLALGPGNHVVETAPGTATGVDLDQLWLASDSRGAALTPTPGGVLPGPTPAGPPAPTVSVRHQDRTHLTLSVAGTGRPFWLVLGQNLSRGWTAAVDGHPLGRPVLVDGYANGWYVPAGLATGTLTVQLAWTPQRVVWVALAASALAVLACATLAVVPTRRRLPAAGAGDRAVPDPGGPDAGGPDVGGPDVGGPEAAGLLAPAPSRPATRRTITAAVVVGTLGGLVSSPWAALPLGAAVVAAALLRRGRLLSAAAGLAMAADGLYMVAEQEYHRFLPTIQWPGSFPLANGLGWAAALLVLADAAVEVAGGRVTAGRSGEAGDIDIGGGPPH